MKFFADCGGIATSIINCENNSNGIWAILATILNILTMGVGILGVLGIIIAGVQYMTSSGNTIQMEKAKKRILNTTIGLAVYGVMFVVLSWVLPGGINITHVDAESVAVGVSNSTIILGRSVRASASVTPVNASDIAVTWSSSDESVATVDASGAVYGASLGTATITATTVNGKTASVDVIVKEPDPPKKRSGGSTDIADTGGYTDNTSVKAAYDAAGNVTVEQVDALIKEKFGWTDTDVLWFATGYEATPSWYIGQFNDYLFSYYGVSVYIAQTKEKGGTEQEMGVIDSWPGYSISLIRSKAAEAKQDEMVRKMLYLSISNPRFDLVGYCGADDIQGTSFYGFKSTDPHAPNSDGGDYRENMAGDPIFAYIKQ